MIAERHASFAAALLDPAAPAPDGLVATPRRFGVYRNNVLAALAGALEARFPVAARIVGEDFFRAMATLFVRAEPPRSPVLLNYGDGLPAFVERFEPAASVPYLPDVIRLEIARSQAYHAADVRPAGPAELARLDVAQLGTATIVSHPATRLLASPHPVATIAAMHAPGGEPAPVEPWTGEDVLITRPSLTVETRVLPPGGHAFHAVLLAGGTIAEAIMDGLGASPSFDAAAALAGLVASGAAQSFAIPAAPDHPGARP